MVTSVFRILTFWIWTQWHGSHPKSKELLLWLEMLTQWLFWELNFTSLVDILVTSTWRICTYSIQKLLPGQNPKYTEVHQRAWEDILLTWLGTKFTYLEVMTEEDALSKKLYLLMTYTFWILTQWDGATQLKARKHQPVVRDTPHVWLIQNNFSYLVDLMDVSG